MLASLVSWHHFLSLLLAVISLSYSRCLKTFLTSLSAKVLLFYFVRWILPLPIMILQNGSIVVKTKSLLSTTSVHLDVDWGIHPVLPKYFPVTRRIKDITTWASMLLALAPSHTVTLDILQVPPGSTSAHMEKQQWVVTGELISLSSFSPRSWI